MSNQSSAPSHPGHRCPECFTSFYSQSTLDQHMHASHQHDAALPCPICRLTFKDNWQLKKHMISHGMEERRITPSNSVFMDAWGDKPERGRGGRRRRGSRRASQLSPHVSMDMLPRQAQYPPMGGSGSAALQSRLPIPPGQFISPYQNSLDPGRGETLDFYCGICGEAVTRSKFSSHSLTHFRDVFEVRADNNQTEQPTDAVNPAECDSCHRLYRKVKTIADILDDRFADEYLAE